MIRILLERDDGGDLSKVEVVGHARFGDEPGTDIVCSAVSALVGYLGLTFSEVLVGQAELVADDGLFRLHCTQRALSPEARVVLEGWRLSVLSLEENYSGWVKVDEQ